MHKVDKQIAYVCEITRYKDEYVIVYKERNSGHYKVMNFVKLSKQHMNSTE